MSNVILEIARADVDGQFREIVKRLRRSRITVLLELPHLKRYNRDPVVELTYGCNFAVDIGDRVLCPPTPRYRAWTTGVVMALHGSGYKGRVKYVKQIEDSKEDTA